MRRILLLLFMLLAAFLGACGGESESPSASDKQREQELQDRVDDLEARDREREREIARDQREARDRGQARRRRERAAQNTPPPATAEPDEAGGGGGIVVPDVVGLDHQAAQNALQGEGLYALDEKDCTGQGRLLLFDRNWEVVRLDPPPGTSVNEDTNITICSKKQGE